MWPDEVARIARRGTASNSPLSGASGCTRQPLPSVVETTLRAIVSARRVRGPTENAIDSNRAVRTLVRARQKLKSLSAYSSSTWELVHSPKGFSTRSRHRLRAAASSRSTAFRSGESLETASDVFGVRQRAAHDAAARGRTRSISSSSTWPFKTVYNRTRKRVACMTVLACGISWLGLQPEPSGYLSNEVFTITDWDSNAPVSPTSTVNSVPAVTGSVTGFPPRSSPKHNTPTRAAGLPSPGEIA